MTFDDYKKKIHPGQRVYAMFRGEKVYGVAGLAYSENKTDHIVKFDAGIVVVNERNVVLLNIEEPN